MTKAETEGAVPGRRPALPVENKSDIVLHGARMKVAEQMPSKLEIMDAETVDMVIPRKTR